MEDYFEDKNTFAGTIIRCPFCGLNISLMPIDVNGLKFCDVICAKLFGDEHGWKTYNFDKVNYDKYYKNKLLSSSAVQAYQLLRKIDFVAMPKHESTDDKETCKHEYARLLYSYANQVL